MAAYLIGQIMVHDAEAYGPYRERVPALVEKYGGRYLVRGGALEALEGAWPQDRVVVIEFPDMTALKRFYDSDEYAELKALRIRVSDGNLAAVEGV